MKRVSWLQPHSDPRLHVLWNIAQMGVIILPFSLFLGCLSLLIVGLAVWSQQFQKLIRQPLTQGLMLLSGLMVLTSFTAFYKTEAWLGLFNFLPFFVVFVGLSELIQRPDQLRQLARILVLTSLPVTVIGFGQQFLGWSGHLHFLWIVLDSIIFPTGNPPGRMASVFNYANIFASYLVIVFILGLGLWIEAYSRKAALRLSESNATPESDAIAPQKAENLPHKVWEQEEGRWVHPSLPARSTVPKSVRDWWLLSAIVLLNGLALILTNSRNAWVVAVLACLAYGIYQGWRWLLGLVGVVAGGVLGAAFAPDPIRQGLRTIVPPFFWARLTDELYPDRPMAVLRITQWQFAWTMTRERPWTGWGLRNFTPLYLAKMQLWLGHPHNLFLMLTAEIGVPAALLLVGMVGWVLVQGGLLLSRWHARTTDGQIDRLMVFSYLVAFLGCTVFSLSDITFFDARINLLGWLLLAAIYGVVKHSRRFVEESV